MLISLDWLGEFVDIPDEVGAAQLAEQLTLATAEVAEVIHLKEGERTAADIPCTLDDWIIDIDNKSITHRPDLWGHYGIAREVAAILQRPLKPLALAPGEDLDDEALPAVPIEIDDPQACPRYSAIVLEGVKSIPSPPLVQARLANVGMRPINALVDLTNYVMCELGQPMHAFDGDQVQRIEVAVSKGGDRFMTLDEVERALPAGAVMIQSARKNVAVAGIMGGLDSEVKTLTKRILLESANFDPVSIRRTAIALGHRTEASTRFEKSLDPAMTVLGIARLVHLGRQQFPELTLASRLSDSFPNPPAPRSVIIDPGFVADFIGKRVTLAQMKQILEALEFKLRDHEDNVEVLVPSFRATKDIEGEADIIEEIARFVGYGNIEPVLPQATVRFFEPNPMHRLERRTLQVLCLGEGYHEIQNHNWYAADWLKQLAYDPGPSISLRNPPAQGTDKLRRSLIPGLLLAAERNRRELPALKLLNIGSTFNPVAGAEHPVEDQQRKHLGLLSMSRGRKAEEQLLEDMKGSLVKWSQTLFERPLDFSVAQGGEVPWEHPRQTAQMALAGQTVGRITAVPLDLRRKIDEHFTAWSVVLAELDLGGLSGVRPEVRRLPAIPTFPVVDLDFSVLVDATRQYRSVVQEIRKFEHPLLQRIGFVSSYQGRNLPAGKRSLLFRVRLGDAERTLNDEDIRDAGGAFETFLRDLGLELRR